LDEVAIVGVGQTKYERRKIGETFADLVFEVTNKALEDAGITIRDIDNVVTVSNDFQDGRTISSMAVMDACGAFGKNVSTVEGDGTLGALYGLMRVLSGAFETTLVVAHCKCSEGDQDLIWNSAFDPVYYRRLGLEAVSASALQARRYMDKYGVTGEQCALVPVKNHRNARANPWAQEAMDLTVEEVMRSPVLASPLKMLDAAPLSDGACAVIFANRWKAGRMTTKPVWVRGVGHCADAYYLGDRDLAGVDSLTGAAKRAYGLAGIVDPRKEIDVVEVFEAFGYQELMWLEGLGFCDPGQGGVFTAGGNTLMDGPWPVNPSGGVLSAHPGLVAGLVRIAEACLQVRGDAGARQVDGVRTALAHGTNGLCGQGHCVWVLGG
jgi:acetyl-CoA C-acetyltransferase